LLKVQENEPGLRVALWRYLRLHRCRFRKRFQALIEVR